MSYESWRISFQSSEQAAKAAYEMMQTMAALVAKKDELWQTVCEEHASNENPPYKPHEDNYLSGWKDACNEILWEAKERTKELTAASVEVVEVEFAKSTIGYVIKPEDASKITGTKLYTIKVKPQLPTHLEPVKSVHLPCKN